MPFQAIPRELAFYDLFEEAASNVEAGTQELLALVDDLPNAAAHGNTIQDLEHKGDDLTHQVMALLNTTFVVPIDRSDIYPRKVSLDGLDVHIAHRFRQGCQHENVRHFASLTGLRS